MIEQNAQDTREIAENLDIPLILDCGSLLGAYREGEPIKDDEDDLDFAVPYEVAEFKMADILEAFTKRGFTIKMLRPTVMSFKRGNSHVDFLFYRGTGTHYYLTLYHQKVPHALLTQLKSYNKLGEIEFLGQKFNCPENIESHLAFRYGDWKTPIYRPKFSFQNYIDQGVMIPLGEL